MFISCENLFEKLYENDFYFMKMVDIIQFFYFTNILFFIYP